MSASDNRRKGNEMKYPQSQYIEPFKPLLKKTAAPAAVICAIFLAAEGFDLYEDYAQYRMETDPAFAYHPTAPLSITKAEATGARFRHRPALGETRFEFEAYKGAA